MPIRTTLAAALAATSMSTAALAQPITDSFLYQGELLDNGAPANGLYDITFLVYDDLVGGTQVIGGLQTVTNVQVTDGRFETLVDFALSGAIFDSDQARYLELRVSEAGQPGTTILAPRQFIAPAPLSNYALRSGESAFAFTSATTLDDAYNNGTTINAQSGPVSIINQGASSAQLRLGSTNMSEGLGLLSLYNNDGINTALLTANNIDGGALALYQNNGTEVARLEPDFEGDAGFFSISADAGRAGFFVDGNADNTNSTRVSIFGSSTIVLDTSDTGDDAVVLPSNSVNTQEILNETGIAAQASSANTILTPVAATIDIINSVTINAPSSGVVLVIGSAELQIDHTLGTSTSVNIGVSNVSTFLGGNKDLETRVPASAGTGTYDHAVTTHGVYAVSPGTNTFYLLGDLNNTTATAETFDTQLSAIFIPTTYGTISRLPDADIPDEFAPRVAPMNQADIQIEQLEALRADNERQERELREMRERMRALEQRLGTNGR